MITSVFCIVLQLLLTIIGYIYKCISPIYLLVLLVLSCIPISNHIFTIVTAVLIIVDIAGLWFAWGERGGNP